MRECFDIFDVLELSNGQRYYGSTTNVENSYAEHSRGKVIATKYKLPCKIIFIKEYGSFTEARQLESKIKKAKNKGYIKKLLGM